MRGVCQQFEVELVEFNGETDHVHLLVNFPPKVAMSKLVNSLKGVSSRKLKMHFPELHQQAWKMTLCGRHRILLGVWVAIQLRC